MTKAIAKELIVMMDDDERASAFVRWNEQKLCLLTSNQETGDASLTDAIDHQKVLTQ